MSQDTRIKQKVDTKKNWESNNPILLDKEIGYERETGQYKIGDGKTEWNDLPYASSSTGGIGQAIPDVGIIFTDYENSWIDRIDDEEDKPNYAIAIGKTVQVGLKGYYIKSINTKDKKIYLSETPIQVPVVSENVNDEDTTFITPDYAAKDEFSMIAKGMSSSRSHYHFIGIITDVNYNVIGYSTPNDNKLPFTTLYEETTAGHKFFVPAKPQNGVVSFSSNGFAEGELTIAAGYDAHAEGATTIAAGNYGHAEGRSTKAGYAAHSEGMSTYASSSYSHAEGLSTKATGAAAHAEGRGSQATGSYSHSEGNDSIASADYAHAEGKETRAMGEASHTEGKDTETTISAKYGHAEGESTFSRNTAAHAEGVGTQANGQYSHAEGYYTQATKSQAHAEGNNTQAKGDSAHAEGLNAIAAGLASHAEGGNTQANGVYSHAEGYGTKAFESCSHAEGNVTKAVGPYSHAEGCDTLANIKGYKIVSKPTQSGTFWSVELDSKCKFTPGDYISLIDASGIAYVDCAQLREITNNFITISALPNAPEAFISTTTNVNGFCYDLTRKEEGSQSIYNSAHAEGYHAYAIGNSSHAEGWYSQANGDSSHAEGYNTQANHRGAHAEGGYTKANGLYSHAEGQGTYIDKTGIATHVSGKYNQIDNIDFSKYAVIIGNGKNDQERSNAYVMEWNGNATFAGKVYAMDDAGNTERLITNNELQSVKNEIMEWLGGTW